ncbi:integrase [Striga asiatica]|uniref:Integrase n=1 Tax=Striga asiatica TaxID=4170 RepID=A0A5A7R4Y2_STRAF|nr:integrase [Striga asiatica]
MVDNAAGEDIGTKTTGEMFKIFETMSTNSSQKSRRGKKVTVNEVGPGNNVMAQQLAELTEQMRLLNARGAQPEFVEQYADASALQGYQARPGNDPFSNTYNPGWRNHPSFSCEQRRVNHEASIKHIETQLGQLATRVWHMEVESDKGKLPSQPEQAKAITVLRSGKVVDNKVQMPGPEDQEVTEEPESEGADAEKIKEEESGEGGRRARTTQVTKSIQAAHSFLRTNSEMRSRRSISGIFSACCPR